MTRGENNVKRITRDEETPGRFCSVSRAKRAIKRLERETPRATYSYGRAPILVYGEWEECWRVTAKETARDRREVPIWIGGTT